MITFKHVITGSLYNFTKSNCNQSGIFPLFFTVIAQMAYFLFILELPPIEDVTTKLEVSLKGVPDMTNPQVYHWSISKFLQKMKDDCNIPKFSYLICFERD